MSAARRLTLTFDNGPDSVGTARVLACLAERDLPGTFFPVGSKVLSPGGREMLEAVANAGHRIGNHSMTHAIPLGEDPDPDVVRREIIDMQELLGDLAGEEMLFRPFGGGGVFGPHLFNKDAIAHLIAGQYTVVLWNSVPRDWVDPDGWPARALKDIEQHDWTVLVLHDVVPKAMDLLPSFLDDVAVRGVEVTADFPDECIPIREGVVLTDLSALTSR
jgi:peptidoglycan/xylan/chitin deacetylase (PgdA/CDA1 family)